MDLFWTNFGPFEEIVDLSGFRGPDILKTSKKGLKYQKIDCRAFAFSRRRYTLIAPRAPYQILDHFGLSKFKGAMPPVPPPIKISLPRAPAHELPGYAQNNMVAHVYDVPIS